jgi:hypothetical protein
VVSAFVVVTFVAGPVGEPVPQPHDRGVVEAVLAEILRGQAVKFAGGVGEVHHPQAEVPGERQPHQLRPVVPVEGGAHVDEVTR